MSSLTRAWALLLAYTLAATVAGSVAGSVEAAAMPLDAAAQGRARSAATALEQLPDSGPVGVIAVRQDAEGRPSFDLERLPSRAAAEGAIERLADEQGVVAVAVESRVRAFAEPPSSDPLRARQWNLTQLGAEDAWRYSRGRGALVAVVDSGVDGNHPDLRAALVPGVDYVARHGNGWNDPDGHGTHVAGTVAAVAGNGLGVAGLAPDTKILPLRVLDEFGEGTSLAVATAIRDAADRGADVVNVSLGGDRPSDDVRAAVEYALSQDVVVVAAMGNNREKVTDPAQYPAAYPGVIAVAATDASAGTTHFSSTGAHVALSAPGATIWSTVPGGRYVSLSGTSMATPHVSAVAAMLRAAAPHTTAGQIRRALVETALDIDAPGFDVTSGAGLIQPTAALASLGVLPAAPAPPPAPRPPTRLAGLPRDWSGDGPADVLAVDRQGSLRLYTGSGQGTFSGSRQIGWHWGSRDLLTMTGDWDGDGHPDLVARAPADGTLWLYRGNGYGGFFAARIIGRGWNGMDALLSPSDWDGDGSTDLLARRRADGTLWLFSGNGRGGFRWSAQIGTGWGSIDRMAVAGDWDSDGHPDLVATTKSGDLLLYSGNGRGRFLRNIKIGHGWQTMSAMIGPGDWDGDRRPDLLAVTGDGSMRLYPSNGSGGFRPSRQVGTGWLSYRLAS